MKRSAIACLFLAATVLGAGCGAEKAEDRTEISREGTSDASDTDASGVDTSGADASGADTSGADTSGADASGKGTDNEDAGAGRIGSRVENDANINHGHSISERVEPDPKEMLRSEEVLHDEKEAEAFLLDNILYPEREPYSFKLTDSSVNDTGAYLWYDFTVCYNGIPVERSEFTVITFNDGTILEGDEGFFRVRPEDLSGIKTPDEILDLYAKQSSDTSAYQYQDAHYLYRSRNGECPYVYVYRYDCGNVLENTTLTLNAKTGELLGLAPDAID